MPMTGHARVVPARLVRREERIDERHASAGRDREAGLAEPGRCCPPPAGGYLPEPIERRGHLVTSRSSHDRRLPAVDHERRTMDERGFVRGEERICGGDLLSGATPPERIWLRS